MEALIPLQMASAAFTVLGKAKAGQAAHRQAQAQAARRLQIANMERARAQRRAGSAERANRLARSRFLARSAAAGGAGDPTTRSMLARLEGEGDFDARSALAEGENRAQTQEFSAGMDRFKGRLAKRTAYRGALADGLSFAAKLASNVESAAR